MKNTNEVSYKELKFNCNPDIFKFETTEDVKSNYKGIGQERGIASLEFGLTVDTKGYNVYLEGPTGSGKTTYTRNYLDKLSKTKKTPPDWCYIYNFENPNEPVALSMPAGEGNNFKDAMDKFIKEIRVDIKNTFSNEDFEKEKNVITQKYHDKRTALLDNLNKRSAKYGFQVKSAENGIYMMPIVDGKVIKEEEFDKLDDEIKKEYEDKSTIVQQQIISVIAEIKELDAEAERKVSEWQSNISVLTIEGHISYVKSKFKRNKKITKFLDGVKKDILKNISKFLEEDKKGQDAQGPRVPEIKPWDNYRVNVFIDNSNEEGAPVIMDSNYSFNNLFGRLEYENYYGVLKTDYTMIRPGLLQKANGGYIIFQANDLLSNPSSYENLKKVLRNKEIGIDNSIDQKSSMVLVSLKPEPIPLDLKVILIGNENVYQTLLSVDEEFRKLFKIKVEFEDSAPLDQRNLNDLAGFVHGFCNDEQLPHLDRGAVARLAEYSCRLAEDKNKLSTQFGELSQVIVEAATWAKIDRSKVVTAEYIEKALKERKNRVKKYDEKYTEMIKDRVLLIDTEGSKVGQINGLTVMSLGDYTFGKPVRITANTYTGKSGIINIEREVELSGSSHSKGILILNGYLGEKFAKEIPLSLTASICFEQLYNGVDGDSASSTELYALLSSLSDVPINQSIAVTGSVNQKGEIQAIGGVNEKIEGFYEICKLRGLNGTQGVMIPKRNVQNLNLNDEIVEAVKNHRFHIYAISTIDEGIEILTGVPAGKKDIPGTINYLVYQTLKKYAKASKEYEN